jgi:hypothetical protein
VLLLQSHVVNPGTAWSSEASASGCACKLLILSTVQFEK